VGEGTLGGNLRSPYFTSVALVPGTRRAALLGSWIERSCLGLLPLGIKLKPETFLFDLAKHIIQHSLWLWSCTRARRWNSMAPTGVEYRSFDRHAPGPPRGKAFTRRREAPAPSPSAARAIAAE